MKEDFLKNAANALKVQKHQLDSAEYKLSEIDNVLSDLEKEQYKDNEILDNLIDDMETLLSKVSAPEQQDNNFDQMVSLIEDSLKTNQKDNYDYPLLSSLDAINIKSGDTWADYMNSVAIYAKEHDINLKEDPFKDLMTKSQRLAIQKRINEEFTFKKANCDKYDYLIAGTCGVIGGLVDILFVNIPENSILGGITDEMAGKITQKFASFLGWDKQKALSKGSNPTASAIGFLEQKFRVNYDQTTTQATGGAVKNLSLKNHHLKSLGHSPDLIGLFFSILNQFTNTSTFISNGQLITIRTEPFELQGGNLTAKIFCGFANWFGHIMSDWAGSSGSVGQGQRGTGIPIPFYNLFQLMNFGAFGQHKQTFATITTKVFEEGYDFRFGMAMATPVLITELLIRFMYTMKARFYHKKDWGDCLPHAKIPELRRMLLIGHGTLCLVDGVDAYIRSGGDMVSFLLRTNLFGWLRFGLLALKEMYVWYKADHINCKAVDEYLYLEYKKIYKQCL